MYTIIYLPLGGPAVIFSTTYYKDISLDAAHAVLPKTAKTASSANLAIFSIRVLERSCVSQHQMLTVPINEISKNSPS